jgi:cupin fold WbuC family metalloprotein
MKFMKNYFIKDATGNSDAFYPKKDIIFDKVFFTKFTKYARVQKKNIRICCHKNKKSSLHSMINLMFNKNNEIIPHKHIYKDEIYNILQGELEILLYGKIVKKIILNKKCPLLRVPKNTFHLVMAKSYLSIFHEIRIGPFLQNDSIYQKIKK